MCEFTVLKALPYYDFYVDIMRPQPTRVPHVPALQVQQVMKPHQVNGPQAVAILGSLQAEGFLESHQLIEIMPCRKKAVS